jgi:hypothetical protein
MSALTCGVCTEALRDASLVQVCGHSFCEACIKGVLPPPGETLPLCPTCGASFALDKVIPNWAARNAIASRSRAGHTTQVTLPHWAAELAQEGLHEKAPHKLLLVAPPQDSRLVRYVAPSAHIVDVLSDAPSSALEQVTAPSAAEPAASRRTSLFSWKPTVPRPSLFASPKAHLHPGSYSDVSIARRRGRAASSRGRTGASTELVPAPPILGVLADSGSTTRPAQLPAAGRRAVPNATASVCVPATTSSASSAVPAARRGGGLAWDAEVHDERPLYEAVSIDEAFLGHHRHVRLSAPSAAFAARGAAAPAAAAATSSALALRASAPEAARAYGHEYAPAAPARPSQLLPTGGVSATVLVGARDRAAAVTAAPVARAAYSVAPAPLHEREAAPETAVLALASAAERAAIAARAQMAKRLSSLEARHASYTQPQ